MRNSKNYLGFNKFRQKMSIHLYFRHTGPHQNKYIKKIQIQKFKSILNIKLLKIGFGKLTMKMFNLNIQPGSVWSVQMSDKSTDYWLLQIEGSQSKIFQCYKFSDYFTFNMKYSVVNRSSVDSKIQIFMAFLYFHTCQIHVKWLCTVENAHTRVVYGVARGRLPLACIFCIIFGPFPSCSPILSMWSYISDTVRHLTQVVLVSIGGHVPVRSGTRVWDW